MGTSECFVCDTCGKHTTMLSTTFDLNINLFLRLPVGWFAQRIAKVEAVEQFNYFCSRDCVK